MGNWGVGIFDGDSESDIRDHYDEDRDSGLDPLAAARSVIAGRGLWPRDIALAKVTVAACQLVRNELDPSTQEIAIKTIDRARPGDSLLWRSREKNTKPDPERVSMLALLREAFVTYDPTKPLDVDNLPEFLCSGEHSL